nr:DHA2 family efflux MFS transporter permease subunit [Morganella morganii]
MTTEATIQVRHPKMMLSVLMAGTFTGLFGETALNMALTNLMSQFSLSAGQAQWLVTGYLLTLAVFVPVSAFLVRWFNTRVLILTALCVSLAGCLIAALSPGFAVLLLGRVIQAIGTGVILPVMLSAALLIFPVYQRGMVMGMVGIAITLAPALGPTISGFIITLFSWHAIFWLSALAYAAIILLAVKSIAPIGDITRPRIDIVSLLFSSAGFSGIIYGLAILAEHSLSDPAVWGSLLGGILCLGIFARRQTHMAMPMISPDVFRNPLFIIGLLMMILSMMSVLAAAIILPVFLKDVLMLSAALAGLLLLPSNIINVVFSPLIGILYNRFDSRPFVVCGALFTLMSAALFLYSVGENAPVWQIVLAFMLLCLGVTCVIMPAQTTAMSALPARLYADGSAVWNTFYQVAGAVGTASAITLMSFYRDAASAQQTATAALASGIHAVFWLILLLGLLSLVFVFFLKKPHPHHDAA